MNFKTKKMYGFIITFITLGTLLTGCKEENTYSPPPLSKVTVSHPVQKNVTSYLEFTGLTEAVDYVDIEPRVEGYLEKVLFTPGSIVKKGDLLFVIDQRPYKAKLEEAKGQLAIQKANLNVAEATLKRMEMAYKDNAVSEVSIIQARADVEVAKASIRSAEATVETAELDLSYTMIHAPITGRIDRNLVDIGNLIKSGGDTLLATIIKDESIYVYFNVNERDLINSGFLSRDISSKEIFLGLLNKEFSHEGKIDYINNRVNPETGNIQVRGIFDNTNRDIVPGMFANIKVPGNTENNALLVPEQVIGRDQQGYYLLSVDSKNIVQYKHVEIGPLVDQMRVIKSGITPNDSIVINGIQMAYPGREVAPVDGELSEKASSKMENKAI